MKRFLPAVLALLLGGCGTVADPTEWFGDEPLDKPAELVDVDDKIQPRILWSRSVGQGTDGQALGLRPSIADGRVYVADSEGLVQALDAQTGSTLWSVETELPLSGGPGMGEGLVYVGTEDAQVVAFEKSSGKERWRADVSSEVLSTPAASMGIVVVHTIDGKLFGLNTSDGSVKWRYDREMPVLTLRGSGSPVINGNVVYCGMTGGKLVALNISNGVPVWDVTVTVPSGRSELERLADIDGDPLVYNNAVYVATYQGSVAALGENSGRGLWSRDLSSHSSVAVDWRLLYVSDENGHVWALDPDTGAARWRNQQLTRRQVSAPAILGDYVVVGDYEGYLHWLSSDDGAMVARTSAGGERISAPPKVVNDTLYVFGDGGELSAIRLSR